MTTMCRTLLLAALSVATPFCAGAQIGDEPPGGAGTVPPAQRPAPPPACVQLVALRDENLKHATAIQEANERRATVQEAF